MTRFLTNMSIGKKITILTAFGIILGIAVFSSLGLRAVNQATDSMLEERLTTAHLLATYIDETLERALTELEITALQVEAPDPAAFSPLLDNLTDTYKRLSLEIHSIYLINQKGEVIWASPGDNLPEKEPPVEQLGIITISDGDEAGISGLVTAPQSDVPVILLSQPTATWNDGSPGELVLAIDLAKSSVGGLIQPMRLGETGYVEIIDQNGMVVARTDPGPPVAPFERSDHSGKFAQLIQAGEPTRGVCHTCHEVDQTIEKKDVLAFVPLSVAPWGVVVRQSQSEALSPVRELRLSLIISGSGLAAVALLFVYVTTRDVGSRIRILTSASQNIADGDLVSPVASLGKDEVGVLAQTLDDMRIKLQASYKEIEKKSKEAEEARAQQEADRLRSEFISSVSHELRTPLTIIKGYTTSLLRQNITWNQETQREFLQSIDEKSDELRELIDKILQSAKLEAGVLKLEKEPVIIPGWSGKSSKTWPRTPPSTASPRTFPMPSPSSRPTAGPSSRYCVTCWKTR